MTTAALVLSILTLILSAISLAWQVVAWKAGGPVVTVGAMIKELAGHPEDAVICDRHE